MATETSSGVSSGELNAAISSLRSELRAEIREARSELQGEIRDLRRWTQAEIERLEREMREVGEMIVSAINRQTTAVVGGVAATTAMMERTRQQIENDFELTRGRIEVQTESGLQIEVGKKVAEGSALKGKLETFFKEIRGRFDRAVVTAGVNRELYSHNFRKITDDYQAKLQTIGQHIFRIRMEDIAPAVKAAAVPYEEAHSLPIEMDLKRLSARSANLDETLELLKNSRLDEVVQSQDTLKATLEACACNAPGTMDEVSVQGLALSSGESVTLLAGHAAGKIAGDEAVRLEAAGEGLSAFHGPDAVQRVRQQLAQARHRTLTSDEFARLARAAESLLAKGLISADGKRLFDDFLVSGGLATLEA